MSENIYEYGTDPKTGLKRRLVRDTVTIQEELNGRNKPKAVIFLRLQTYVLNNDLVTVVTDNTASFNVVKGEISTDVNGDILPKYIVDPNTGVKTLDIDPETGEPYARDNGYDNIIILSKCPVSMDSVLDDGIKEYYKIQ